MTWAPRLRQLICDGVDCAENIAGAVTASQAREEAVERKRWQRRGTGDYCPDCRIWRCWTCGGQLDWVDDMYHCRGCGDEYDYETIRERED